MADAEQDALQAAKAFRPNVRPFVIAFLANATLAVLCFGVPWYRGHAQGEQALRAFNQFAACMLGAEPGGEQGLGLPQGDTDHFAAQVMLAGPSWPAKCKPSLKAIAPEEAIFLWPSVKQAAADVRALVQLVDRELDVLTRQRVGKLSGRVPARPLLAMSRLRAGLSLLAKASDADDSLDRNAVRFTRAPRLIAPSQLPLLAASSAALQLRAGQDGLSAIAIDGSGISWLRLEDGKIDRHRVRRTSLVRGALWQESAPLLVWAMPESRCAQREDACARRATGVATLDSEDIALPKPTWLGGHPAARVDRSLRFGLAGRVDLLARKTSTGAIEMRRFTLPQTGQMPAALAAQPATPASPDAQPAEPEAAPPLDPEQRWSLLDDLVPSAALLLHGLPSAVAYTAPGADGLTHAWLWSYEAETPNLDLGSVQGDKPFLAACEAASARYVAFGTQSALAFSRIASDGTVTALLPSTALELGAPIDAEDPAHDRLRILCEGERIALFVADARGKLLRIGCAGDRCDAPSELAQEVATFDAVQLGDTTFVAYSRMTHPEIIALQLDPNGRPLRDPITPGACWDPRGGLCGQPTLATDGKRLLLGARDAGDLLALEWNAGTQAWMPISGLKVSTAINTDPSAPMDQHRKRKGLD